MSADFYEILGIPRDANTEAIKKAYRQKARLTHPDVNPAPEAITHFQQLQEAYSVLKNPESRALYDRQAFAPPSVPPPQAPEPSSEYRGSPTWNTSAKYDPAHRYTNTDYTQYRKSMTIIGIITLLFSMTYLVDFLFDRESLDQPVVSIQVKGLVTQKTKDLGILIVRTEQDSFEKTPSKNELKVGDLVDIKRSLIHGFPRFKRSDETSYQSARAPAVITYIISIIVYIAGLNAIMNKKNLERKFNAGLIAVFFSVMLIFFAILN